MWLHNCWYVIAWDHEVPDAGSPQLFRRVVLNEPILVYRLTGGGLVALADRCCHRGAPLSKGRREGDCVRCGYHGLKFDAQGTCIETPGVASIPSKARVRTYPLALKNRWIFVWMGDPAQADTALLPDNFSCDHPEWRNVPGYMHYEAPQLLVCDNLLDFSHLSFVHERTLGASTEIATAVPVIEAIEGPGEEGLRVTRRVNNVPAPPFYQRLRRYDCNLNRWFTYEFLLPGTLLMHSGARPVTASQDDEYETIRLHSCQSVTPETETTTHYFFQQSHRCDQGDEAMAEAIYRGLVAAFEEDRDMITAQFRNISLAPETPMLPLAMDAALMRYRRLLERRMAAEYTAAAPECPTKPKETTS